MLGLERSERDRWRRRGLTKCGEKSCLNFHAGTWTAEGADVALSHGHCGRPGTLPGAALLVELLDQVQAAIVVFIVQDNEQLTQLAAIVVANNHENLGQLLIREVGRKRRNGLDVAERPDTGIWTSGWWLNHQEGTRFEPLNLVVPTGIVHEVPLPELPQDSESNLGIQGDLVPKAYPVETRRPLDWIPASEKAGIGLTDSLGNLSRVQLNVVDSWT